jgi:hypothetical protein
MELQLFGVTTTVFVEAADAGEAALVVERDLAGRFDNELVSISAHEKAGDGPRCPGCGSERTATFDGWGYTRVLDSSSSRRLTEVSQITIPETADPAFGVGFGDLTVHEVEVPRGDPNEGGPAPDDDEVAYFSWYAGGFRVWDITDTSNPTELGHYIDPNGNSFWGVALAEDQNGDRIVLASDQDFALFIFRYTGDLPT